MWPTINFLVLGSTNSSADFMSKIGTIDKITMNAKFTNCDVGQAHQYHYQQVLRCDIPNHKKLLNADLEDILLVRVYPSQSTRLFACIFLQI